jgi:hypothetical protein
MMMKYCEDHAILDTAYLDPMMVVEALVVKKLEEHQNKRYNWNGELNCGFLPRTPEQAIHIPTLHLQVYI